MSKMRTWVVLLGMVICGFSATAMGQPAGDAQTPAATTVENQASYPIGKSIAIIGACFGAGFSAIGGGYAIARIGQSCIESVARQPEAAGSMFAPMIVTAAMVEGGMLFAMVVCLLGVLGI